MKIIEKDNNVKDYDLNEKYALDTLRHTCSHVLAQAIKRLYPKSMLAIGPHVDTGFYYDIDFLDTQFSDADFDKVEKEMSKIIDEELDVERFTMPRDEAIKFFKEKKEDYKVMLIEDLPADENVYFAKQGEFVDLCSGPHLTNIKILKDAFKLISVAGAYWRGDEHNKMLTRIYGTAFFSKDELHSYLDMLEEAKKRDHRKLGKELNLFMMSEYGPGFPFFLPNGMRLRNALMDHWMKIHYKKNYDIISTPVILSRSLWETSGHWDHYKDNMYTLKIDDQDYAIKPMNCPGSILVYQNEPHSYRDLPLRYAEPGLVHRNEKSGELHGLMRVRSFTQDDAHIYITPEQIEDEVTNIIDLYKDMYDLFNFEYTVELSTMPEDHMGTIEEWTLAENSLKNALDNLKIDYILNEGDGAFYGPKIDFHLKDCIGRTWQCGTIQLDFQLPQRFNLFYIDSNNEKKSPIMIHRACFGSIERFIGILIEHFMGAFPTWLSPTQVMIIPVSDKTIEYSKKVYDYLNKLNIRVSIDDRAEKMGYKIREAQTKKIPYMLVIGSKEEENNNVSVRSRFVGDEGLMNIDEFANYILTEIETKEIREVVKKEE